MVTLKIDGKSVEIEEGKTVLDAAQKLGIKIPTLCHHSEVAAYGACRLCQVEATNKRGKTRLVVSCLYPVEEGLSVQTGTERVKRNRRMIIELLLARCPEVKALQELAREYGINESRFRQKDSNCILCGLCVRVCSEVLGANVLGFAGRGTGREIKTAFGEPAEDCLGCGLCTYVCPTGAIQMESEARKRWQTHLLGPLARQCRYSRMGLISYKTCPNDFMCSQCEVDQMLEDKFGMHPAFVARPTRVVEKQRVDLFTMLPNLYYTKGHIWLKPLNGKLRVGLDDFASQLIGSVKDIKLPEKDRRFASRDALWELILGDRGSLGMLSPFAGRVADVNPLVRAVPQLTGQDPYRQGWILTIEPDEPGKVWGNLLYGNNARTHLRNHAERLHQRIEKDLGVTMTDGSGALVDNLPAVIKPDAWNKLAQEFFQTV